MQNETVYLGSKSYLEGHLKEIFTKLKRPCVPEVRHCTGHPSLRMNPDRKVSNSSTQGKFTLLDFSTLC